MKWFEDVSLSNGHSNVQKYFKACEKTKIAKGQIGPGPVLVLGTGTGKTIWANTGQPVRQHLNTYFHADRSSFLSYPETLCRMKVMAPPHPFQTFSRNKKMQAKCHSAVKQQEHLLVTGKTTSCAGAEQLRSGRRGGNSILYYRDAQSTPKMSMNFQSERNCPSPANSHTETLDIQFIPLIHGHKDVYAVTQC